MKGLKILACTLLFVLLSACGINGNHQESAASSDTDVSPEEQESNSQTENSHRKRRLRFRDMKKKIIRFYRFR